MEGGRLLLGLRCRKLSLPPPRSVCTFSAPPPPTSPSPPQLLVLAFSWAPPSTLASKPARATRAGGTVGASQLNGCSSDSATGSRASSGTRASRMRTSLSSRMPTRLGPDSPPSPATPWWAGGAMGLAPRHPGPKWRTSRDFRAGVSGQGGHHGLPSGVAGSV